MNKPYSFLKSINIDYYQIHGRGNLMIKQAIALEQIRTEEIITVFMKNKSDLHAVAAITKFANHKHNVSPGVINGVIIYCLLVKKGVGPQNPAYYRKAMEDFKLNRRLTTHSIIEYLVKYAETVEQTNKRQEELYIHNLETKKLVADLTRKQTKEVSDGIEEIFKNIK